MVFPCRRRVHRLIRMLVVPLVLTSIIHVILHMNEGTNLKKLVGAMLATNLGMVALRPSLDCPWAASLVSVPAQAL